MMKTWREAAIYCAETYGVQVDWEDRFFICPECGEPIYECDWEDEMAEKSCGWAVCLICETNFVEDVE